MSKQINVGQILAEQRRSTLQSQAPTSSSQSMFAQVKSDFEQARLLKSPSDSISHRQRAFVHALVASAPFTYLPLGEVRKINIAPSMWGSRKAQSESNDGLFGCSTNFYYYALTQRQIAELFGGAGKKSENVHALMSLLPEEQRLAMEQTQELGCGAQSPFVAEIERIRPTRGQDGVALSPAQKLTKDRFLFAVNIPKLTDLTKIKIMLETSIAQHTEGLLYECVDNMKLSVTLIDSIISDHKAFMEHPERLRGYFDVKYFVFFGDAGANFNSRFFVVACPTFCGIVCDCYFYIASKWEVYDDKKKEVSSHIYFDNNFYGRLGATLTWSEYESNYREQANKCAITQMYEEIKTVLEGQGYTLQQAIDAEIGNFNQMSSILADMWRCYSKRNSVLLAPKQIPSWIASVLFEYGRKRVDDEFERRHVDVFLHAKKVLVGDHPVVSNKEEYTNPALAGMQHMLKAAIGLAPRVIAPVVDKVEEQEEDEDEEFKQLEVLAQEGDVVDPEMAVAEAENGIEQIALMQQQLAAMIEKSKSISNKVTPAKAEASKAIKKSSEAPATRATKKK